MTIPADPHARLLYALAQAKSKQAHKRAIHSSHPAAARAAVTMLTAASRDHGMTPKSPLARAQLNLLAHPGATHEDFKKATEDQHGEGLGSFLGGLAKGLFAPVKAIGNAVATAGKAIFHSAKATAASHHVREAARHAAKEAAKAGAEAATQAATQALVNKVKAQARAKKLST